ncbi:ornithine decarboxylase [Klebsormidium nitens]|uniref:ornithine decarboxylase n=1 Tax=Klebsormidium nitens TaxID=105231 RepID=A0A1Y1HU61_KLENI|nr:ornithine decarboxylase [Klebsormidium nitens]|eukprot:GAQ82170.1 ornithine decarboxylase [Klebsormidium nitens]
MISQARKAAGSTALTGGCHGSARRVKFKRCEFPASGLGARPLGAALGRQGGFSHFSGQRVCVPGQGCPAVVNKGVPRVVVAGKKAVESVKKVETVKKASKAPKGKSGKGVASKQSAKETAKSTWESLLPFQIISSHPEVAFLPGTMTGFEELLKEAPLPLFQGGKLTCKTSPAAPPWQAGLEDPRVSTVVAAFGARSVGEGSENDIAAFMRKVVAVRTEEDPFYVFDMGLVVRLFKAWKEAMPRVDPFYAVKCNPDPGLLSVLAALGAGFDVASKAEIEMLRQVGVPTSSLLFANPCKMPGHIRHAAETGVNLTTFDSEGELHKLKELHPQTRVLLRIRADDPEAQCPLGVKYGALVEDVPQLLTTARALGIHVAGISFHVGSGAGGARAHADAICAARRIFDLSQTLGLPPMTILDIGGGFSVRGRLPFARAAAAINAALDAHFPPGCGVSIIAEPGRYFAEAPGSLATCVFGHRGREGAEGTQEYWTNDGMYGSMNCVLYDHATLDVRPLRDAEPGERTYGSTVFGPTCDGLDTILRDYPLPRLQVGDWLVWSNMGAYTQTAGSAFNGFNTAAIPTLYVYSTGDRLPFTEALPVAETTFHRVSNASSEGDLLSPTSDVMSPRGSDDGLFVMEDAGGYLGSSIDSDKAFLR